MHRSGFEAVLCLPGRVESSGGCSSIIQLLRALVGRQWQGATAETGTAWQAAAYEQHTDRPCQLPIPSHQQTLPSQRCSLVGLTSAVSLRRPRLLPARPTEASGTALPVGCQLLGP